MSKLWTFGDSFSQPFLEWSDEYLKWKGYTPKVYGEIVSQRLGMEYNNIAKIGNSNYDIFESICKNIHLINKEDVVVIGWSNVLRFRLANTHKDIWQGFQPDTWDSLNDSNNLFSNLSKNTIDEILYNRSNSDLYKKELLNWITLLEHTLKDNPVINWTWSKWEWEMGGFDYETIWGETDGTIRDLHWSENGHYEFSDWIISKINLQKFWKFE